MKKKKKKTPKQAPAPLPYIIVGGKRVYIQRIEGFKESTDNWGIFAEEEDGKLYIKVDKGLSGAILRATICHESVHAVFHISGITHLLYETHKGLEETIVRQIEYMFLPSLHSLDAYIKELS